MREDNPSDIDILTPKLMNSLPHRIYGLRVILQHAYGGIFMALGMFPHCVSMNPFPKCGLLYCVLGYYLSSPQCFITGVLSEFSFEILDMVCANSLLNNFTLITLSNCAFVISHWLSMRLSNSGLSLKKVSIRPTGSHFRLLLY